MSIEVKLCGINTPEAMDATVQAGADMVGLNFYPKSPRAVTAEQAARLAERAGNRLLKAGLFVEPDDELLSHVTASVPLDLLQLHGALSPQRVAEIRGRYALPVMRVLPIAREEDFDAVAAFEPVADRFLFDAKPPKSMKDALPGGNAVSFDWTLLSGRSFRRPWMLAGGLTAENVAQAIEISGTKAVDTASGIEDAPGRKSAEKIAEFVAAARRIT